ncbi:hypothetical protein HAX54_011339 [Datura stramonium]|uniref:Uncharacterized protein n=1 Tax=Datura stramonium TaxID=4076 RepID=A0ABS8THS9_DATST|nr:hypothetical protein [Datura stramonium]
MAEAKELEANLKKVLELRKNVLQTHDYSAYLFPSSFTNLADMSCKQIGESACMMRAECAEAKVASENKLAEAQSMMEDAQKKYADAEEKLRKAESLEAEASLYHRTAERKLREVESREDDLRRETAKQGRMMAYRLWLIRRSH